MITMMMHDEAGRCVAGLSCRSRRGCCLAVAGACGRKEAGGRS